MVMDVDLFLSSLPAASRQRFAAIARLDAILARHLASGRSAWPELEVSDAAFLGHLARLLPEEAGDAELGAVHAADLYLACACAAGGEQAMRLLERAYFIEVDRAARRVRADASLATEVRQVLRRRLFVGDGDKPAGISLFAGRGDLRGWIRVAATRELLHLLRRQRREIGLDDGALLDLLAAADDPELRYIGDLYREPCNQAFRAALAATPAQERSLLRYQLVDGLSIDEIGALHGVHRATAARWLAKARDALLERVRGEVAIRLQIALADVDSVLRLVKSRLEISLETALRA
jgi:RNA polymerase sigma-70 factor (ECF subfamily)